MSTGATQRSPRPPEAAVIGIAGETVILDCAGAIFLPQFNTLVVSDLHLEKGSAYAARRQMLPPYDTAETLRRLRGVIDLHQPESVISLGDSFHDGTGHARMADTDRLRLLSMMSGRQWIWVTGNHDPGAPGDLPGQTVAGFKLGELVFRHEPSHGSARGEIAGHLHPGARVVQRGRSVRRPCFVTDGERLLLPAFGAFTGSLNVRDQAFAPLFGKRDVTAYMLGRDRVYAVSGAALVRG